MAAVECADRFVEAGSRGRIRTTGPGTLVGSPETGGLWLPFRVTDCEEYRWTWRVGGVRATGHRVEPAGENCRVVFEVPLLVAGYAPVCSRALADVERLARATG